MPGNKDIVQLGRKTRFDGSTAAEANRKSCASKRRKKIIRDTLRGIATDVLYGAPALSEAQLEPIRKQFGLKRTSDVTYGHIAMYRQAIEAAKGDRGALELLAAFAGEKPVENVAVTVENADVMAQIRARMTAGGDPDE